MAAPLCNSLHMQSGRDLSAVQGFALQKPRSHACALQSTYSGPPRLVVFGGNGFVGSRVCQEGLKTGLAVASVNRSGAPKLDEPWVREVEWVRVSCSCTCRHALSPMLLVIHSDGGMGMQADTPQPDLRRLLQKSCWAEAPAQLIQLTLSFCSSRLALPALAPK